MIRLDGVVRVLPDVVMGTRQQIVEDTRIGLGAIGVTSVGSTWVLAIAREKNSRAAVASRRWEKYTSTTWPNWSMAGYRERQLPATFT